MAATAIAKARRLRDGYYEKYFVGKGIDMGCGDDPVTPDVVKCEPEFGCDAQKPDFPPEEFNFVFSSHCLEHLPDPALAIKQWWRLVKPDGYLVISVPDWFLYEQKTFPSRFNHDHKWTFSMFPLPSVPHSKHIVFSDLFRGLFGCQIISYRLFDTGYNYDTQFYDRTWHDKAEAEIEIICRKHQTDYWTP